MRDDFETQTHPVPLTQLRGLFGEIAELKRVTSARMGGQSVAASRFASAWARLAVGDDPCDVARGEMAAAAVHVVMGPIDDAALADAEVSRDRRAEMYRSAVAQALAPCGIRPSAVVLQRADRLVDATLDPMHMPGFVPLLSAQPRAGAVAADAPRLVLSPQESHAEHCWCVAVMAAILAEFWSDGDAEMGEVFLLGMAHHFPNAWLPDGGFAGELVLGDDLGPIFSRLNARACAMLPDAVAQSCRDVLALKDSDATPVGRVFNAADVIDRVLQQRHHAAQASFRLCDATETRGLVHEGPLQSFQNRILSEAGLS